MCHHSCIKFAEKIPPVAITGKRIIDVGGFNVNGTCADYINLYKPSEYLIVDLTLGRGVTQICDVVNLISTFGENSFDVVISTEMMEHVQDWKAAIHNMKAVCKFNGYILITTRSQGFSYHGFPHDHWRFSVQDMQQIFADCNIVAIESDPVAPGVFVCAIKRTPFNEVDLENISIYNIEGKRY